MYPRFLLLPKCNVSSHVFRYHVALGDIPQGTKIMNKYFYTQLEAEEILRFFAAYRKGAHGKRMPRPSKIDFCSELKLTNELFLGPEGGK